MTTRVRMNDNVLVLAGKDNGKQGLVIAILPKKGKIMVKGVAVVARHVKAKKQGDVSEIKRHESFIDISNVMPVCSSCKKACRTGSKKLESGDVVRMCNHCKEAF